MEKNQQVAITSSTEGGGVSMPPINNCCVPCIEKLIYSVLLCKTIKTEFSSIFSQCNINYTDDLDAGCTDLH